MMQQHRESRTAGECPGWYVSRSRWRASMGDSAFSARLAKVKAALKAAVANSTEAMSQADALRAELAKAALAKVEWERPLTREK